MNSDAQEMASRLLEQCLQPATKHEPERTEPDLSLYEPEVLKVQRRLLYRVFGITSRSSVYPINISAVGGEVSLLAHIADAVEETMFTGERSRLRHFDDTVRYSRSFQSIVRKLGSTRARIGLVREGAVHPADAIPEGAEKEVLVRALLDGLHTLSESICIDQDGTIKNGNTRFLLARLLDISDDDLPVHFSAGNTRMEEILSLATVKEQFQI